MKSYPAIINYRCKNHRKFENHKGSNFCNAVLKRKTKNNETTYELKKPHSEECVSFLINNFEKQSYTIFNYKDYIDKCNKFLDSTEEYNRQEFTIKLQNIYNENKYNFSLKENTIKNIIDNWKKNSLRFTKFNAIINNYNKNNELILWEHINTAIYVSNKKKSNKR